MTKQEEIGQLKTEQDTAILTYYYVGPQVQEVMGYIGDSLYLSKVTVSLGRRTMVLCNVSFMGESGKLLSPDKAVLMPGMQADCPIAHMVAEKEAKQCRRGYPDLAVVCYINSTVRIKPWSDVCVTFASTVQVIRNPPNRGILLISDKNLGRHVASQIPEKYMMPVGGCCPVHDRMSPREISALEGIHPNTQVLARPEYNTQVLELADYINSTTETLKSAAGSTSREFIIYTEDGIRHELERQNPGKHFRFLDTEPICWDIKKTTLGKIIHVLHTGQNQASVSKAYVPSVGRILEQMSNLARQSPENRFQTIDFRRSAL